MLEGPLSLGRGRTPVGVKAKKNVKETYSGVFYGRGLGPHEEFFLGGAHEKKSEFLRLKSEFLRKKSEFLRRKPRSFQEAKSD